MNEERIFGILHIRMDHLGLAIGADEAEYNADPFSFELRLAANRALMSGGVIHNHPRFLIPLTLFLLLCHEF